MIDRIARLAAALVLAVLASPAAQAQSQNEMPGMAMPKNGGAGSGTMQGTDMDAQMKQCAEMRQTMKPGAAMSSEMRKMMIQCDEMNHSMGSASQPYVPPAHPTR